MQLRTENIIDNNNIPKEMRLRKRNFIMIINQVAFLFPLYNDTLTPPVCACMPCIHFYFCGCSTSFSRALFSLCHKEIFNFLIIKLRFPCSSWQVGTTAAKYVIFLMKLPRCIGRRSICDNS